MRDRKHWGKRRGSSTNSKNTKRFVWVLYGGGNRCLFPCFSSVSPVDLPHHCDRGSPDSGESSASYWHLLVREGTGMTAAADYSCLYNGNIIKLHCILWRHSMYLCNAIWNLLIIPQTGKCITSLKRLYRWYTVIAIWTTTIIISLYESKRDPSLMHFQFHSHFQKWQKQNPKLSFRCKKPLQSSAGKLIWVSTKVAVFQFPSLCYYSSTAAQQVNTVWGNIKRELWRIPICFLNGPFIAGVNRRDD